jgi:hypothetical protein
MNVQDLEKGCRVEYETERDEIIEGIVVDIVSPTQVLIKNHPGTGQQFIAHPDWLTRTDNA